MLSNDKWKSVSAKYPTLEQATAWIKSQLNIALTYTEAVPQTGDNPKALGWYERSGTSPDYTYTATADTTVDNTKTYYVAS